MPSHATLLAFAGIAISLASYKFSGFAACWNIMQMNDDPEVSDAGLQSSTHQT
jgi:hypothetical protein